MIYFVRFYFNVPNFVHPNPKAADNPKTLIKVINHILDNDHLLSLNYEYGNGALEYVKQTGKTISLINS